MDEVHLAQVGLRRVGGHPAAVPDRHSGVTSPSTPGPAISVISSPTGWSTSTRRCSSPTRPCPAAPALPGRSRGLPGPADQCSCAPVCKAKAPVSKPSPRRRRLLVAARARPRLRRPPTFPTPARQAAPTNLPRAHRFGSAAAPVGFHRGELAANSIPPPGSAGRTNCLGPRVSLGGSRTRANRRGRRFCIRPRSKSHSIDGSRRADGVSLGGRSLPVACRCSSCTTASTSSASNTAPVEPPRAPRAAGQRIRFATARATTSRHSRSASRGSCRSRVGAATVDQVAAPHSSSLPRRPAPCRGAAPTPRCRRGRARRAPRRPAGDRVGPIPPSALASSITSQKSSVLMGTACQPACDEPGGQHGGMPALPARSAVRRERPRPDWSDCPRRCGPRSARGSAPGGRRTGAGAGFTGGSPPCSHRRRRSGVRQGRAADRNRSADWYAERRILAGCRRRCRPPGPGGPSPRPDGSCCAWTRSTGAARAALGACRVGRRARAGTGRGGAGRPAGRADHARPAAAGRPGPVGHPLVGGGRRRSGAAPPVPGLVRAGCPSWWAGVGPSGAGRGTGLIHGDLRVDNVLIARTAEPGSATGPGSAPGRPGSTGGAAAHRVRQRAGRGRSSLAPGHRRRAPGGLDASWPRWPATTSPARRRHADGLAALPAHQRWSGEQSLDWLARRQGWRWR